jgi:dihydrofolate reductase
MSKVICSMMLSLDGFIEGPKRELDWHTIGEELHTYINDQGRAAGAFLYGRRAYEIMIDYWPTAGTKPSSPRYEAEFASIWKGKPKIVVSTTLERADWATTVVKGNVAEEIGKLKARLGGDLMLYGGRRSPRLSCGTT